MSERITAANLDEVIKRNEVIEEQMKQSASLIWSKYNPMQINSPIQLALQILRPYGSVSYTHLDVYKRQPDGMARQGRFLKVEFRDRSYR